MESALLQCMGAFFGCLGFSFIFRLHKNMDLAFVGALNGLICTVIYLLCGFIGNDIVASFIAMFFTALIAEGLARLYRAPATIFMIVGCFPLVPGRGIYTTMLYAVEGDIAHFGQSALHTMGIAFALALAILISSSLLLVIKRLKEKPDIFFEDPYE